MIKKKTYKELTLKKKHNFKQSLNINTWLVFQESHHKMVLRIITFDSEWNPFVYAKNITCKDLISSLSRPWLLQISTICTFDK